MARPGDIFSIKTPNGEAYFQYVKNNKLMGSLIRVFPGTHLLPPENWSPLVEQETNFWIFFPVGAALKKGIIRKIANCPIPVHAEKTPLFRAGVVDPSTGRVENWWLWDGEKEWKVGKLTDEQRRLPIRGSWNDTLLVERIQSGWLPEHDPR